jgi:hypothetical protein
MSKIQSAFWLINKYIYESIKSEKDGLIKNNNFLHKLLDFLFWMISQRKNDQLLVLHNKPWLPYSVVRQINKYDLINAKLFEYGSGSSTLFFLEKGCEVISVEHDKEWFDIVSQKVSKQGYKKWQGTLCPPEETDVSQNNEIFKSKLEQYNHKSFNRYVNKILDFPDDFFDFIVIDGRARSYCFQRALPKLKTSGIIIWDNVERERYGLHELIKDNRFKVEVIGGATPGVNFFTRTAFITKLPDK